MDPLPPRLVLFDGECGLCDRSVQWILRNDPSGKFQFATLQGPTAAEILGRHRELPPGIDSVILVESEAGTERVFWRSRAIFRICRHLQGRARWLAIFGVLPSVITDIAYRLVARFRHRIWGRLDQCRIPRPDERARFLP